MVVFTLLLLFLFVWLSVYRVNYPALLWSMACKPKPVSIAEILDGNLPFQNNWLISNYELVDANLQPALIRKDNVYTQEFIICEKAKRESKTVVVKATGTEKQVVESGKQLGGGEPFICHYYMPKSVVANHVVVHTKSNFQLTVLMTVILVCGLIAFVGTAIEKLRLARRVTTKLDQIFDDNRPTNSRALSLSTEGLSGRSTCESFTFPDLAWQEPLSGSVHLLLCVALLTFLLGGVFIAGMVIFRGRPMDFVLGTSVFVLVVMLARKGLGWLVFRQLKFVSLASNENSNRLDKSVHSLVWRNELDELGFSRERIASDDRSQFFLCDCAQAIGAVGFHMIPNRTNGNHDYYASFTTFLDSGRIVHTTVNDSFLASHTRFFDARWVCTNQSEIDDLGSLLGWHFEIVNQTVKPNEKIVAVRKGNLRDSVHYFSQLDQLAWAKQLLSPFWKSLAGLACSARLARPTGLLHSTNDAGSPGIDPGS